ncbi:three-helix bundle dimerization domain-containing protein [Amycolatopsis sp. CA-161197]|uniref:three-helix bundle dimerization domain-containing protein n=1 Tax=unclassified Amycolatopsis TaxID=2618356 RepID=UPI003455B280
MTHQGMDDLMVKGEEESFSALKSRLVDEYGSAREPEINRTITAQRRHFDDAGVRSFLPVLVERQVRDRLGEPQGR